MLSRLLRTPLTWAFVTVLGVAAALGLYWFQPWKLFTDTVVTDALPQVATSVSRAGTPDGSASPGAPGPTAATGTPEVNRLLATGEFIAHEHDTSGTVQLVRLADGRHQLVLRDLDTSNGPDLRVWLTDRPVVEGRAGWRVFDDGEWVEVAKLKGNRGDQVYELPSSVDPAKFRSVSIWCKRFAVSFGAAELRAP